MKISAKHSLPALKITRTVNGRPVSDEEMSSITLLNEGMRQIIKQAMTDLY